MEFILKNCNGTDINTADSNGDTPLIWASYNGHHEVVVLILKEETIDVNKANNGGRTALWYASQNGLQEVVDLLLKAETIDVNKADDGGRTALYTASRLGHAEVVDLLLMEETIDVNKVNNYGKTALYWASRYGRAEVVQLLINHDGFDINKEDDDILYSASENGLTDLVRLLIGKEGINVNKANDDGKTALYWASTKGHARIVKLLLKRPDIEINKMYENDTILWISSHQEQNEIVQILLEHPKTNITKGLSADEDINVKVSKLIFNEETALENETRKVFVATILGDKATFSALLQSNETLLNSNDSLCRSLLFWASTRGHIQIVKDLLNNRILVNKKRSNNEATALYQGSKYGLLQIVDLLLHSPNIEVNIPTLYRRTPLMASTINGYSEVVKRLLSVVNIDMNYATFDGKTALIYAVSVNESDILELLLRCPQTDTSLIDEEYKTAFDIADDKNMTKAIKLFKSRGKLQMQRGHTCCSKSVDRGLHTAVRNDDVTWLETFLVCPDIKINVHNKDGQTPLNLAIQKDLVKLVKIFLADQRIDVNKPNTVGKENALLIASGKGNTIIMKLVLCHNQTDVNQLNANREPALQIAIQKYEEEGQRKHFRTIKLLLRCPKTEVKNDSSYGSDVKQAIELRSLSMDFRPTCCLNVKESLLGAAWVGDFRAIRGLLDCPGSEHNVNTVESKGRTPLYIAAMKGHREAVDVVLQNQDVDVNIGRRVNGGTAFSIASEKSHFDVMQALIVNENGKALIVSEKCNMGKGWCIDNWTKPCKQITDLSTATTTPPTSVPSSEFRWNVIQTKSARIRLVLVNNYF